MMRLIKCTLCIALVYLLSPLNGLSERETLDGVARLAIGAQTLAPEAARALDAARPASPETAPDGGMLRQLAAAFPMLLALLPDASPPAPRHAATTDKVTLSPPPAKGGPGELYSQPARPATQHLAPPVRPRPNAPPAATLHTAEPRGAAPRTP